METLDKLKLELELEYEQKIYEIFANPYEQLKPLEELYREANPHPDGKFYLPDMTKFCKWITEEFLRMKKRDL